MYLEWFFSKLFMDRIDYGYDDSGKMVVYQGSVQRVPEPSTSKPVLIDRSSWKGLVGSLGFEGMGFFH